MPPRVTTVNAAGTGVSAWYWGLPPMTRFYATTIFAITLLSRFKLVNVGWLAMYWPRVISHFEVWRLVTCFFFMGRFSFNWFFRFIWLLMYGRTLEEQSFQFDPAGFLYMLLFGAAGCLVADTAMLLILKDTLGFYALSIVFMMLYVWSREFPDQQVSIYGLFKVQSVYVPFVFLALEFLIDGSIPWSSLIGLLVGHMYFYLTTIYPRVTGIYVLRTPLFLRNLLADLGVGRRVNTHGATGQDGFRAFGGRGRRLNRD